jgi:hypothetical protein
VVSSETIHRLSGFWRGRNPHGARADQPTQIRNQTAGAGSGSGCGGISGSSPAISMPV